MVGHYPKNIWGSGPIFSRGQKETLGVFVLCISEVRAPERIPGPSEAYLESPSEPVKRGP